jgi:hypothetical protein
MKNLAITVFLLLAFTVAQASCIANYGVSGSETPRDAVQEPESFGLDNGTVG